MRPRYLAILMYFLLQIIAGESQEDILLAVVNKEKLVRLMEHILDEKKFLSPYGIRSLSKVVPLYPLW